MAPPKQTSTPTATGADSAPFGLAISNFGPIAKAHIVPGNLTVFIGPSGSGKSFAATALYGYASAGQSLLDGLEGASYLLGEDDNIGKLIREVANLQLPLELPLPPTPASSQQFANWRIDAGKLAGPHIANLVFGHVSRLLESSNAMDLRRSTSDVGPNLLYSQDSDTTSMGTPQVGLTLGALFAPQIDKFEIEQARRWLLGRDLAGPDTVSRESSSTFMAVALLSTMGRSLLSRFGTGALYFPAGRTGLLAIRHVATLAGVREGLQLRGPASQFIPDLMRANAASRDGELAKVVDEIELLLHGGSIGVRSGPSIAPDLMLNANGLILPMERASSSVAEMAPVTFILRRLAKPGGFVIIEEPEAHLHPSKQFLLAESLVRLIRAGLRVVITTHSELLLRKLGALLMESALADRAEPTRALGPTDLRPDDLAVYRFKPAPDGGFETEREEVTAAGGIDSDELDRDDEALYEQRVVLRQQLGDSELAH